MDEEDPSSRAAAIPLSYSSVSGDAGPSTSSQLLEAPEAGVEAEQDNHESPHNHRRSRRHRSPQRNHHTRGVSYRYNLAISHVTPDDMRDDVWSCLVVLVTFWFFAASMTLILGFYGSSSIELGPNCSRLITANAIFVQYIKAQQIDDQTAGPMLYGFHKSPSLDVETTWSESHSASVEPNYHKEWTYYLNEGSKISMSYDVKYPSSAPLSLVIAQGRESLVEWIEDPSYPNATLSWNIVYGSGNINQDITSSSTYYIAVGNLNSETVQVDLNMTIETVLYNTTQAYFKCSLSNRVCSFKLLLLKSNAAVLTSPGPGQVKDDDDWYIKVSFGPRWVTYFGGSSIMTILILSVFKFCNMFQSSHSNGAGYEAAETGVDREPLLSPKDDDLSSWGSSYDSVSNDEEDMQEKLLEGSLEGKLLKEGENNVNPRRCCVICFDGPRDCFFLPCGHCAACFTCGSRIAEEAGTCPLCRRKMKKVRKIFAV